MAFNKEASIESGSFHTIAKQIPVKISELYRPPRKVTVSSGVLQRKHAEDFGLLYDFSLDKSIVNKMGQIKRLRSEDKQNQKKCLAAYYEARELEQFNQTAKSEEDDNSIVEKSSNNANKETTEDVHTDKKYTVEAPPMPPPSYSAASSAAVEILASAMSNPMGSHLTHAQGSPALSPTPSGHHSPHNDTTTRSPVSFTSNAQPVSFVSTSEVCNEATTGMYQKQTAANSSYEKYSTQSNVSNSIPYQIYPTNITLANSATYSDHSNVSAPILGSYTSPRSVNDYPSVLRPSVSTSHPHSFASATPPSVPLRGSYSSASQSLPSPNVHTGMIPGNSPQVYAPQYANVLQPTHLLSEAHTMAVIKEKHKVNVKDFEQDTSSPFDSCELKSINDMEELRHVLEHCVMKQEQLQHQQLLQQYQQHMQQSQQQQHQQQQQQNQHQYKQFMQYSSQYGAPDQYQVYQIPNNQDQQPIYNHGTPNQTYPPQCQEYSRQQEFLHDFPSSGPRLQPTQTPLLNKESRLINQSSNSFPSNPLYIAQEPPPNSQNHQHPANHNPSSLNPSHNPEYTNPPPVNNSNFHPYPSSHNSQLPSTVYASKHATHDQHNASSSLGHHIVRVPSVLSELRNELMRKRESDIEGEASAVHSPTPEVSPPSSGCDTTPPIQVSYLPNPYLSLTNEEQERVDRIVEMGFLQSRTARAWQALGPSQDKIVEFLIQVLALEEKFPPLSGTDLCEESLKQHHCDVTATESFLTHVTNLTRLGFSPSRVAGVLRSVNNNEEKALDLLVT